MFTVNNYHKKSGQSRVNKFICVLKNYAQLWGNVFCNGSANWADNNTRQGEKLAQDAALREI